MWNLNSTFPHSGEYLQYTRNPLSKAGGHIYHGDGDPTAFGGRGSGNAHKDALWSLLLSSLGHRERVGPPGLGRKDPDRA